MDSSSSTNPTSPPPVQKNSDLFCDPGADVVFISSDKVVFRIHGAHLQSGSGVLGVYEGTLVEEEPVPLPELSKVLEILFQFIEPPAESRNYRQPSVFDMQPKLFFELAEAAEKYIVYGAMNVCITHMRQVISQHPLEVLNHCARHGYPDLADNAAKHTLSCSLESVASEITAPDVLHRWLIYNSRWRERARSASRTFRLNVRDDCIIWANIYNSYLIQIDRDPTSLVVMPPVADNMVECTADDDGSDCDCQLLSAKQPPSWFKKRIISVPNPCFSSISI